MLNLIEMRAFLALSERGWLIRQIDARNLLLRNGFASTEH
jgi:hypothetical protein